MEEQSFTVMVRNNSVGSITAVYKKNHEGNICNKKRIEFSPSMITHLPCLAMPYVGDDVSEEYRNGMWNVVHPTGEVFIYAVGWLDFEAGNNLRLDVATKLMSGFLDSYDGSHWFPDNDEGRMRLVSDVFKLADAILNYHTHGDLNAGQYE